tara:strand:- start:53 stop:697 length:645 start_codon:yes stop_codon:yes gene_type:complete
MNKTNKIKALKDQIREMKNKCVTRHSWDPYYGSADYDKDLAVLEQNLHKLIKHAPRIEGTEGVIFKGEVQGRSFYATLALAKHEEDPVWHGVAWEIVMEEAEEAGWRVIVDWQYFSDLHIEAPLLGATMVKAEIDMLLHEHKARFSTREDELQYELSNLQTELDALIEAKHTGGPVDDYGLCVAACDECDRLIKEGKVKSGSGYSSGMGEGGAV